MSSRSTANIEIRWGVEIPLRDDLHLSATVYTPAGQRAPLPSVVTLTPYTADFAHERGAYYAANGLTFVAVDVRGRGNSEGTFRPFIQEARDGHDVVEWVARQPFCNGKVAMRGGSYSGYCQWVTAKEFPAHLATIVPTAAPYIGVDFPMRNNVFYPYLVQWLAFTSGRTSQATLFSAAAFWCAFYRRWHESGRSFRDLDTLLGNPLPVFQEWLSHPERDAYWDAHNPTSDEYARLSLPVLTITGSYDDDQAGALEHYKEHTSHASPAARARHYLVIGPWDHQGAGTPVAQVGGLQLGPESLVDLSKLHLEWYAWTLQGGPRPDFLKKRVTYYVTGAERWRYADTLEEVTARYETHYLDSRGRASDVFAGGGVLQARGGSGPPDSYTYDPSDTDGLDVAAEAATPVGSVVDQSVILALTGKALIYHSAPFEQDTELSGFFRLAAWMAIDCPDTDFYVSVHEIALDGRAIRLSTDVVRARYREGLRTPRLIRTREPLRYDFERFTFVSRQVRRGHRLRLVIAPVGRLIDAMFTEKNHNSGGRVAEETVEHAKPVTVRLFHDDAHPSALYVPWGHPESPGESRDAGRPLGVLGDA